MILGLSALVLNLAFRPWPLPLLSFFALIPWCWIVEKEAPARVFRYSLFFGAVFSAGHLWWLWALVVPVQPVTRILLDIGVVLLFLYLGLWVALAGLVTKIAGLIWMPLVWATMEWLRTQSDAGFPWGLLGTSLTPYPVLLQGAALTGIYGISALIVAVNLALYKVISSSARGRFLMLTALLIGLPLLYGAMRIKSTADWFRVGIVQPNVAPLEKNARSQQQVWEDMLHLSREAIDQGAQLLLYPETATLTDITRPSPFAESLVALSRSHGVLIVTGTPLYRKEGYMNAAVAIGPEGVIGDPYVKLHPAPFSERFPFVDRLPLLRRLMTADMGELTPGREYRIFTDVHGLVVRSKPELHFAVPICFEGIFPELVRQFAHRGARLIAVVTNDGWFGRTPGPYQHSELMIPRTVENGVPLIRAANNGISLVADPYGRVIAQTRLFEQGLLVADVPAPLSGTFYRSWGDQFAYGCLLLTGVVLIVRLAVGIQHRRRQKRKHDSA